jgi:hypothetical protein
MTPINKFILHVVHNWTNELNEAYTEKAVNDFIKKFSEEADDLNISVSEPQLRKYIERFDTLKNSPKITEKDLNKWSLSKLIRLITSTKGAEVPEEMETTPDIVYNQDNLIIYNGSKEGNCLTYGRGEQWCITRGSFGNYRYDDTRKNPTFYLVKDNNLSDSDRKSFFVVVVGKDNTYKVSDRSNNDVGGRGTEWERWESWPFVEQNFPSVRGLRSIFKYIPLSSAEKINQSYKNSAIPIREFIKFPYSVKEQYLVVRKGKELFKDVSTDEFVSKYLPQYPQLATFISTNAGIIPNEILIKHLDKFSNQDTRSVISNMREKVKIALLSSETIPFDVKKLLIQVDKWDVPSNERLYTTKDGNAIVKLKFGDEISVGVYTAEDDYPNIKLNQRTAKYLLDYPKLDELPFNSLLKLAADGVVNKEFIAKVIEKAKSEENSAIIVKKAEDGEILVDANSFSSYKIKDGNITKIPFTDEEVQTALGEEKDNTAFQQGAVNIVKQSLEDYENIPPTIDKDAFVSIVKSTPYDRRTFTTSNTRGQQILLVPDGESRFALFTRNVEELYNFSTDQDYGNRGDWRSRDTSDWMDEGAWRAYFTYLRNENKVYEGNRLNQWFRGAYTNQECRKAWFKANPPLSPADQYAIAVTNDNYYVVNKANPRESLKLSDSGKLVKANIPSALARQLLGAAANNATPIAAAAQEEPAVATPAAGEPIRGRGRPAGQPNAPRAAAPIAAGGGGDINVAERMAEVGLGNAFTRIPMIDFRRLNVDDASRENYLNDRGASRRNNQLGGAGRVGQVLSIGPSKIYFIRLADQTIIASINIQPGNRNYILLPNGVMVTLNSPAELMQALRQRNLAEVRNYMVREYLHHNPQHLDEIRGLIQQHVNETKNK